MHVETGGVHSAIGKSGEHGALQFLPSTWEMWSKEVAGRVLPFTEANERYVALLKVQRLLDAGYTARGVALVWNQGHTNGCSAGTNKHGVQYDSCAYAQKVLASL